MDSMLAPAPVSNTIPRRAESVRHVHCPCQATRDPQVAYCGASRPWQIPRFVKGYRPGSCVVCIDLYLAADRGRLGCERCR